MATRALHNASRHGRPIHARTQKHTALQTTKLGEVICRTWNEKKTRGQKTKRNLIFIIFAYWNILDIYNSLVWIRHSLTTNHTHTHTQSQLRNTQDTVDHPADQWSHEAAKTIKQWINQLKIKYTTFLNNSSKGVIGWIPVTNTTTISHLEQKITTGSTEKRF